MDIQILGRDGSTIHEMKISEGAPASPPEILHVPEGAIPEIAHISDRYFVRAVGGNPAVYRPAYGVLGFGV